MVNYLEPKAIFEIGTYNGLTTLQMVINAPPEDRVFERPLARPLPGAVETINGYVEAGQKLWCFGPA